MTLSMGALGVHQRLTAALAACGCCHGRRTIEGAPCLLQPCAWRLCLRYMGAAAVACTRVISRGNMRAA